MDKKTCATEILKYWYFLEFISQPDFPYPKKAERDECNGGKVGVSKNPITIFESLKSDMLSCGSGSNESAPFSIAEIIMRQNRIYRSHPIVSDEIDLCIGKIDREIFAKKLESLSGEKLNTPEKRYNTVGLIGLKCDQNGVYIPGSLNISPLAWGTHRLMMHQQTTDYTALLSIEAYHAEMNRFEMPLLSGENRAGEQFTGERMKQLIKMVRQEYLRDIMDATDALQWDGVLIYRRYDTEDSKAEDKEQYSESELFRSFFSRDLRMVSQAIDSGELGNLAMQEALLNYICGPYAEAHPELGWHSTAKRVNVFDWNGIDTSTQMDFFCDRFDIANAPLGKWPSRFRPALMQQMAINSCWCPTSENQPIFSVNGPPGTGKTTLLKEIVAGNIVARACQLAEYTSPDDAFEQERFQDGDKPLNGYSKYYNTYFKFKNDSLKNYGILVASCNNFAVENITKEMPDGKELLKGLISDEKESQDVKQGLQEIYDLFRPELAEQETYRVYNAKTGDSECREIRDIYFTKLANDLATALEKQKSKDAALVKDRWGLISAPFGKRSNLKCYISSVLKTYVSSFGTNNSIEGKAKEYPRAVERFLKQYQKVIELKRSMQKISGARSVYLGIQEEYIRQIEHAKQRIEALEEKRSGLEKEIQQLCQAIKDAERELACNQNEADVLHSEKLAQKRKQHALEEEVDDIRQQIIRLEQSRHVWDYVLEMLHRPTTLSKTIQVKKDILQKTEKELEKQAETVKQVLREYFAEQEQRDRQKTRISQRIALSKELEDRKKHAALQQNELLNSVQDCYQKIAEALSLYKAILQDAASREPAKRMEILDEEFMSLFNSKNEKEKCEAHVLNPWQSAEYDREREKLFFEALRLHKAFLLGSKRCLWNFKNLLLFWNEPGDDKKPVVISDRDRKAAFGELLNTVFLLTPVLSTTFASVETMLKDIDTPGEIGCLIIDEAGQATPQMAVGALYRSRRAIVVGDPKQVEPVVTDELDLLKRIVRNDRTQYYQDKALSVQGFADRLNCIGTYYMDEMEKVWVGCPLVVHRRCISPMFDISNAISYDHTMKQQTKLPDLEKEATFCKENSGWINVCGSENNTAAKDHYVQTQGEKAWKLVLTAFKKVDGVPSLFVVTPFTSVKDGFVKFIQRQPEYRDDPNIKKWAKKNIGTIHTFQGKEADQVIFLLGCDKNAIPAVKWVNTNMVNVAVTRAKFRLYVIGDYLVWKESEVFRRLKGILDSYAIRALYKIMEEDQASANRERAEYLLKQMPDIDSLTIDGELDEQLLSPLSGELSRLLSEKELTEKQLEAFNLSKEDMAHLPDDMQKRLLENIFQHSILTEIKAQCQIELSDASATGVLFCKLMESMVKKQFFEKFQTYFSKIERHKKALAKPYEKVTLGTFTNILKEENCQHILASKGAVLFGSLCDLKWWNDYTTRLEAFKALRNACCHLEPFSWEQYEQMIYILFVQREFMNTLVGDALPA